MEDVVITAAVRTPIGNYGGLLKDYLGVDLATSVLKELVARSKLENELHSIGDVIMGQCMGRTKEEANMGRVAAVKAGLPVEVPSFVVQRACASALQAIICGVQEIMVGQSDIVIAGGSESMTNAPYELYGLRWGKRMMNEELFDTMYAPLLSLPPTGTGMGQTAENLADKFDISRQEMDEFALASHQKAMRAQKAGAFLDEMLPLEVRKDRKKELLNWDESIRETTLEKLAQLPPAFKKDGRVTAGNACGLNDCAAAVVMMRRSKADEMGLKPLARFGMYAVVGLDPDLMGYGPVPSTRRALERSGLKIDDFDLIEVNEAFAPVPLVFMRELGADPAKVNVNGGAIALGHPIGATGARLVTSLVYEMQRRDAKRGLVTMCQGTGMGTAMILERD